MKFRTVGAVLVAAAILGGGTAAADNYNSTAVTLTYVDTSVDQPVAEALAELNESNLRLNHGTASVPVDAIVSYPDGYADSCIVAVGHKGEETAEALRRIYGLDAVAAQGADRYQTAYLAAVAVSECN